MKNPLQYQRTEYDCGPTTLLNALSFLFEREEIPPELVQYVMVYCLDSYSSDGERGKSGTSYMAMMFLSSWINHFASVKKLPIQISYLSGSEVDTGPNSQIVGALQQGGVVVARVMYDVWHYVLLTGYEGNTVTLWDPYYRTEPFKTEEGCIEIISGCPQEKNRRLTIEMLSCTDPAPFALGPVDEREAVIIFNKNTQKTPERTIEYFI